jgi:hypothetical protein
VVLLLLLLLQLRLLLLLLLWLLLLAGVWRLSFHVHSSSGWLRWLPLLCGGLAAKTLRLWLLAQVLHNC